jgi:hypothetical protein
MQTLRTPKATVRMRGLLTAPSSHREWKLLPALGSHEEGGRMKVSELIERLECFKKINGDLDVNVCGVSSVKRQKYDPQRRKYEYRPIAYIALTQD